MLKFKKKLISSRDDPKTFILKDKKKGQLIFNFLKQKKLMFNLFVTITEKKIDDNRKSHRLSPQGSPPLGGALSPQGSPPLGGALSPQGKKSNTNKLTF